MIHIDGIIYSLQNFGGITVCFNELITRLKKDEIPFELGVLNSTNNFNNTGLVYYKKRILEQFRSVDHYGTRPSVFHSTYYRVPTDKTVPVVTTVHDFTYEKYIGGLKSCVHTKLKQKAIARADKVICVSESTKRDMLEYMPSLDESKVSVVYNGVSSDYHPVSNRVFSSQVLFVGSRAAYKNFDVAVKAVSRCADLSLVIVGGGDLNAKELKLLNEYLYGRFTKLGFLSNSKLNLLYNNAYCLIHPSSYEGFGISIVEAMRAKCPVLCTDVSSISEVYGKSGETAKKASVNQYEGLLRNLYDTQYRSETINNGFLHSKLFSWEKNYEQIKDIYHQLELK